MVPIKKKETQKEPDIVGVNKKESGDQRREPGGMD